MHLQQSMKRVTLFLSLVIILFSTTMNCFLIIRLSSTTIVNPKSSSSYEISPKENLPIKSKYLAEISQINWSNTDVISVIIEDNIAYLSCYSEGIKVVNVTDIFHPVLISNYSDMGNTQSIAKKDNYLFLANGLAGLTVLDISNIYSIQKVAELFDGGTALDIKIWEDYCFIADGTDGIEIIDISDPLSPKEVSQLKIPHSNSQAISINYFRGLIEIALGSWGMIYVDINDIGNPSILNYYTESNVIDIYSESAERGYYSWAASGPLGVALIVWSGSYYTTPYAYGRYSDGGSANGLAFYNNGVFVADGFDGIEYIQHEINQLEEKSFFNDGGWAMDVVYESASNRLFVADGSDGLEIIGDDLDNDYLADLKEEEMIGTDSNVNDTDGDGYLDGIEVYHGTDPLNAEDFPDLVTTTPSITIPDISTPPDYTSRTNTTTSFKSPGFGFGITLSGISLLSLAFISHIFINNRKRKK
ncbi:MAG: hypothetical protein GF308_08615 [Candidatus Heimdallarchaeota archaeon]|nr:hypothetical protein [Candidatus Heimdallarchaeota archaeon]